VLNCVVLVRLDASHSRRHHILGLESPPIRPTGASVQEQNGSDDILGGHSHADINHVFRRLCVDIQVRMKPHTKSIRVTINTYLHRMLSYATGHNFESALRTCFFFMIIILLIIERHKNSQLFFIS